ncbi:LysR family transcriptional regulator [Microbacterium arborescens]|jgi:DNA-binding transcriptional LysR family regulator|uniref:LysR family transcriptional regulator n=1 Tax=Microbacterium arborescens TaxID=33883 RepID=UPI003C7078ED
MAGTSLDHVRTFVTVFRTGSLTRAAQLLGVSQATASAHVQALEATLGFALFVRGSSGVSPTAKGVELAREVATHVDALEDAAVLASRAAAAPRAVHVGGAAEILSFMVVPHLRQMIDAVGAPIRLVFGLADDLLDGLLAGAVDVVVSAVPPRRRGIAAVPFYDEEFVLVAGPGWQGVEPESIPVVAYAEDLPIIRRYWRSVFERAPTGLRVAAVIPDLRDIREVVRAGVGMSVLPSYLVAADLTAGTLVALERPEVAPLNTLYLATRGREADGNAAIGAVAAELRRLIH